LRARPSLWRVFQGGVARGAGLRGPVEGALPAPRGS